MIQRLQGALKSRFVRDTLVLQTGKAGAAVLSFASSLIVWRLLGPERYGAYGLAQSFLTLWQILDLSGLGSSTASRLGVAIGARDDGEVRELVAYHLQMTVLINIGLIGLIALVGQPAADRLHGSSQIGQLTLWLATAAFADQLYALIATMLQARRSMQLVAMMGVVNQFILSLALIIAAVVDARAEGLAAARLSYSFVTLLLAIILYIYVRGRGDYFLPTVKSVLDRIGHVPVRRYWRFGIANAIDKNLADVFIQIPIQIVGVVGGERAVGYLNLAMTGIVNMGILTSAVFENLKAVVPQTVGRKDYVKLWDGARRVIIGLMIGSIAVYGLLAVTAPVFVPPILGEAWIPAIPVLIALTPFGVISATAGVMGPIYRALELMRGAIQAKLWALVLVLIPGSLILMLWAESREMNDISQAAIGGALMINALFAVQALLTARVVFPKLGDLAKKAAL